MNKVSNLSQLISEMDPILNPGEYVFVSVKTLDNIDRSDTVCEFKEDEGVTLVLERKKADELGFAYDFVAAWITLKIHSALNAVGLTAAFSTALTNSNISCNVVAGYYHDHIFVNHKDAAKALKVLKSLSNK